MSIFQAFILGLVQGLGEFLPISSSAHLIIVPWLFGWRDPGLSFDVALHWGTLLAALLYFWADIFRLLRGFGRSIIPSKRDLRTDLYQRLSWLLIIASIPGALVGAVIERYVEDGLRSPLIAAVTLAVFGAVLWIVDRYSKKDKDINHLRPASAFGIGMSQALSLIPGVSRSGATITAGLLAGLTRADAARFSFLMSIPITFGAGLLRLNDLHYGIQSPQFIVGFLTAAVSGFLAIKYLLRYLSHYNLNIFVWYRLVVAVGIVGLYIWRG